MRSGGARGADDAGTGPRLARLLPRREAAEHLDAFVALLPGFELAVVDARGTVLAVAGPSPADGADPDDAWRCAIEVGGGPLGAVRVRPAPAGADALAAVALHAGVQRSARSAVDRRELAAETLERYREVNLLYRLGDALGGELDPVVLPERVLEEALRLVAADGAVLVLDAGVDGRGSYATAGAPGALALLEALEATRGGLVDESRPAILGDARALAGSELDPAVAVRLWAPLRSRDRTIGGLLLARPAASAVFTAGDAKLLAALATQSAAFLDNARMHQRGLTQARMARELQLAHEVQARLMPGVMPASDGWQIAASWRPAREVAGDFFDATRTGDDLAVAVGDVADKGMAAALFMALTRSVLRASAAPGRSAGEVVRLANVLLCADAADGMFVTLAYALLGPGGDVRYANAGHTPPLVVRSCGRIERLARTGILVGWDETAEYDEARIALAAGDVVVIYTDGVTEARSLAGDEYGQERLESTAILHRAAGADGILSALLEDLAAFVGDAEPYDDATLMVIARRDDGLAAGNGTGTPHASASQSA